MASITPVIAAGVVLLPPETFSDLKLGSPYIHNGAHTHIDHNKCTLCWKFFCAKCDVGNNSMLGICQHCNET